MMDFLVRLVEGRSLTEAVLISTGSTSIKQTDLHVCAVRQDRDATRSSAHMPVTTRLRQVCALLLSYYPQIGPADDAVVVNVRAEVLFASGLPDLAVHDIEIG